MRAVLGKKLFSFYKRITGIDSQSSEDLKEILFNTDLTNKKKLMLLKIKIKSAMKSFKGSKRKQFIFLLTALLLFSVNGNVDILK